MVKNILKEHRRTMNKLNENSNKNIVNIKKDTEKNEKEPVKNKEYNI